MACEAMKEMKQVLQNYALIFLPPERPRHHLRHKWSVIQQIGDDTQLPIEIVHFSLVYMY